jgi:hypothetical protein
VYFVYIFNKMPNNRNRNRKSKTNEESVRYEEGVIVGNGDYKTLVRKIAKPVVKQVKNLVGNNKDIINNIITKQIDGRLGLQPGTTKSMQKRIVSISGRGDYTVKTNSLIPNGVTDHLLPKFDSSKRAVRVVEKEYIGDIVSGSLSSGSSLFTNVNYPIIPTDITTFPWLSSIAVNYDQWVPNGIVFEYVSTSSSYNGTNQSLGTVIMSSDYDTTDPLYVTKQAMENADYACSTKPSENLVHGLECDISERPMKVLYTKPSSTTPNLFSTLANFQVATVGCSAAGVKLGELWVSYDISFYKKQLSDPATNLQYCYHQDTTVVTGGLLGGSNIIDNSNSDFRITTTVYNYDTLIFPEVTTSARYLVSLTVVGMNVGDNMNHVLTNCTSISLTNTVFTATSTVTMEEVISISGTGRAQIVWSTPKAVANASMFFSVTAVSPTFRLA